MTHQHGRHSHAAGGLLGVRRHHPPPATMTEIISVVYQTLPAPFPGPIGGFTTETANNPSASSAPSIGVLPPVQQTQSTFQSVTPTADTSTLENTQAIPTTPATLQTAADTATSASRTNLGSTSAVGGSSISASQTPSSAYSSTNSGVSRSSGISSGAKAGVAIGVLLFAGLIAALVLLWVRNKKQNEEFERVEDNEKSGREPTPPPPISKEPFQGSQSPQSNVGPLIRDIGASVDAGAATASFDLAGAHPNNRSYAELTNASPLTPSSQNPFSDPTNPFSNKAEVRFSPDATPNLTPSVGPPLAAPISGVVPSGTALEVAGAEGVAVGAGMVASVSSTSTSSSGSFEKDMPTDFSGLQQQRQLPAGPVPTRESPGSAGGISVNPVDSLAAAAPSNVYRVQMVFQPSLDDELELHPGQTVRMLHEYDDGWVLCVRIDRSQQGVCPRSCLSARPLVAVKSGRRAAGAAKSAPRAVTPVAANGRPRSPTQSIASSSGIGVQSPRFYVQESRPTSPSGHPVFPAAPGPPPQRPPPDQPISPLQFPSVPRSMSPGPYGYSGWQTPTMPAQRARSNSASGIIDHRLRSSGLPKPSPLAATALPDSGVTAKQIQRKPVPGQS